MQKRAVWLGVVALLWLFAMTALYYVSHKPFDGAFLLGALTFLWRLIVVGLLVSLAGGLGARLLPLEDVQPLTRLALQAALGLGLMALLVLLMGSIGLARWWLIGLMLLGGVVLLRWMRIWWRNWQALAQAWQQSDGFGRSVAVLCALLLAATLLMALAPPLAFDALVSHLVLPQLYLQQGRVSYLAEMVMSGMPQNAEMLYTWAMAAGGAPAAAALGWAFGVLALVGVWGWAFEHLGARAAWAGVASLLAGYSLTALLAWAYVDWLALLFGWGTLVWLERWRLSGQKRAVWLAGLFTGLAIGVKYTSGILALVGVGVLAWHAWRRREAFLPTALRYGLAVVALSLPWFLKNWLSTGNPLYPFLFPAGAMTALRLEVYQSVPPFGNWQDVVFLPVRAMYLGMEGAPGYMVAMGPLLVGLAALAWLGAKARSLEQQVGFENALALTLLGWAGWAVGNQVSGNLIQTRYYFTLFPAFAFLAAYGFWGAGRLSLPGVRMGRILAAVVLLALGLNTLEVTTTAVRQGAGAAALGLRSQTQFVADGLGWYEPAMAALHKLPGDGRVLMLYEPRSLYCLPVCEGDEILDQWKRTRTAWQDDATAIVSDWRAQGYGYVLVYTAGVDFFRTAEDPHHPPEDLAALDAFLDGLRFVEDFGGVYALYALP